MPNFAIEIFDKPPYLKLEGCNFKDLTRLRPAQTTSPPQSLNLRNKKKKNSFNILSSSAPTSYQRINTTKADSSAAVNLSGARNGPPRHSTVLTNSLPHHMSLQHISLSKSGDFEKPSPRPMSVRAKMSSSLYSLPNLSAEASTLASPRSASSNRLSHHEPLADPNTMSKWSLSKEGRASR